MQSQIAARFAINTLWIPLGAPRNCGIFPLHINDSQPNSISEDESNCSKMNEEDNEENQSDNFNLNLSFSAALTLLCNPKYHLVDAFLELSNAHSIALAILLVHAQLNVH